MPRYFFNTRIGDELISDPEGEELRNPDRAWEVARAMIRELLKIEGVEGLMNAVLEVTDDEGEIVLEFPFAEAILDGTDARRRRHARHEALISGRAGQIRSPVRSLPGTSVERKMFPIAYGGKIFEDCGHEVRRHGQWVCLAPGSKASTKGEHYEDLLIGAAQPVAGRRLYWSY